MERQETLPSEGDPELGFQDLRSYTIIRTGRPALKGNLIKRNIALPAGIEEISVDSHGDGAPTVLIHRQGSEIESVEFVCGCGQTSTVKFEYSPE